MSALSNVPAQAVLPLAVYDLDDLRRSAGRADQRLLEVDLAGASDKAEVLRRIAEAFGFPPHFGHNLDALYDCLTDLEPVRTAEHPGFVVLLRNLPDTAAFGRVERDALLDAFRDAADFFFDRERAFRLFYSVAARSV